MLQHLRLQGEEAIHRLRQEAEAKVREQRSAAERDLTARQAEAAAKFAARLDLFSRTALMAAKRQADQTLARAHTQLAARLRALAVQDLACLRDEGYAQAFARLVRELPGEAWEEIKVHPDDQGLARAALPQARIVGDGRITGGLEVMSNGGRMRVDNTLAKRLERAWPELLPKILRELGQVGRQ